MNSQPITTLLHHIKRVWIVGYHTSGLNKHGMTGSEKRGGYGWFRFIHKNFGILQKCRTLFLIIPHLQELFPKDCKLLLGSY